MKKYIEKNFDFCVTVLMGLAAIAAAFMTLFGALWGSVSTSKYSQGSAELTEAHTSYLSYVTEYVREDLRDLRFSSGEITEAEYQEERGESHAESLLLKSEAEKMSDKAYDLLEEGEFANNEGDKFQLISGLLSVVLFFGSLSLSTKEQRNKNLFFFFASFLFFLCLLYASTLSYPPIG